jgi:hypothetical protein
MSRRATRYLKQAASRRSGHERQQTKFPSEILLGDQRRMACGQLAGRVAAAEKAQAMGAFTISPASKRVR